MSNVRLMRQEEGSEVVSFVLVSFLVTFIFLALLQCSLIVYRHNVVISVAGEGARRYALLGGSTADARGYVTQVCAELLGDNYPCEVSISREPSPSSGSAVGIVRVRTTLPLVFHLGPTWLEGKGSVLLEGGLP